MNTSTAPLTKTFQFGCGQNCGFAWPLHSLESDIRHYAERVDDDEEPPVGEDPVDGSLAEGVDVELPGFYDGLISAMNEANASGDLRVGFRETPSADAFVLSLWRTPRRGFDPESDSLGEFSAAVTEVGVAEAVAFLANARSLYRPATVNPPLPVCKVADISTKHITESDCALIEDEKAPGFLAATKGGFGAFFYLPDLNSAADLTAREEELRIFGFSQHFIAVVRLCHVAGVPYVRFDADGQTVDGVPVLAR